MRPQVVGYRHNAAAVPVVCVYLAGRRHQDHVDVVTDAPVKHDHLVLGVALKQRVRGVTLKQRVRDVTLKQGVFGVALKQMVLGVVCKCFDINMANKYF